MLRGPKYLACSAGRSFLVCNDGGSTGWDRTLFDPPLDAKLGLAMKRQLTVKTGRDEGKYDG